MSSTVAIHLESLTPREAIVDVLSRVAIACDLNDLELFNSVWAGEDASAEIHDGELKALPNLALIRKHIFEMVGPMDTTHNVSNVRVDLKDGANTAFLTATSLAQHCPPGRGREPDGPKFLVGGQYSLDLVKNDANEWKIKKFGLKVIWREGDPSVMMPKQH
ncbi:hypothetical protein V2G26_004698 [Clonostachys chloroleuca]|uniref:SnoaL-like domain-containing protein n=1 Tax=Clonostachys chloroleuca TaxID=1926264 RepID=A0AA35MC40_9HYPO|nr:unnamed protein product [Clonostachys chloroleuca]